jgi:hypothetical protein
LELEKDGKLASASATEWARASGAGMVQKRVPVMARAWAPEKEQGLVQELASA